MLQLRKRVKRIIYKNTRHEYHEEEARISCVRLQANNEIPYNKHNDLTQN